VKQWLRAFPKETDRGEEEGQTEAEADTIPAEEQGKAAGEIGVDKS